MSDSAFGQTPLSYLGSYGERADRINTLLWGLIVISLAVIVMSIVLVLSATFRRRTAPEAAADPLAVDPGRGGAGWVVIGVGTSTVVLFVVTIWTVVTLAATSSPPGGEALVHLHAIGHQWWWELRYDGDSPDRSFRTANEIHIPTGAPVGIKLESSDVIHSFWVPSLTGKTELIPGQSNVTWLSAARTGIYRGQCSEFCGQQHAHMGFEVVAESPDAFKAWWDHQLEPAALPTSEAASRDLETFIAKCGACHTVRGTRAGGILGPDLSHLMTRRSIAAATLPNTIGYLSGWIADTQHVKPGAFMPTLDLSAAELNQIRRFLETLR